MKNTQKSWGEMIDSLNEKAGKDPSFKTEYKADPKSVIEKQFNVELPENVSFEVHENTVDKVHITLPVNVSSVELSSEVLDTVAGGQGAHAGVHSWRDKDGKEVLYPWSVAASKSSQPIGLPDKDSSIKKG